MIKPIFDKDYYSDTSEINLETTAIIIDLEKNTLIGMK